MTEARAEQLNEALVSINLAVPDDQFTVEARHPTAGDVTGARAGESPHQADDRKAADETARAKSRSPHNGSVAQVQEGELGAKSCKKSEAKVRLQDALPVLDDDADIGVEKEHIVTRDGKADLLFMGTLLASASPDSTPQGEWQEYRIYQTNGGKHVFSRVRRSVREDQNDTHEAEVFDPAPASVPSQLMRSAREIARAKTFTWMDAAVAFFGYDALAKILYRKLNVRFEEQIT